MRFGRRKPEALDPIELEAHVLRLRDAVLNGNTEAAEAFLQAQPASLYWPLHDGLKQLFNDTPEELWAKREMQAVGFYILSIYGD